jgi:hypothetical protein
MFLLVSYLCILVPLRLKARKFMLVPPENSPGLTSSSSTTNIRAPPQLLAMSQPQFGSFLHASSMLLPPTSAPLALLPPQASIDQDFEDDVENLRSIIRGSNLKRKFALLSEVWAGEIARSGEGVTGIGSVANTGETAGTGNGTAAAEEAASEASPVDHALTGGTSQSDIPVETGT